MLTPPSTAPIPQSRLLQIGEVAELTGLSLRTIRYYEEVDLVVPARRTDGGFRLYDSESVERFRLVMLMKLLGFGLDETRELVDATRRLENVSDETLQDQARPDPERDPERDQATVAVYLEKVADRIRTMTEHLSVAQDFSQRLAAQVTGEKRELVKN